MFWLETSVIHFWESSLHQEPKKHTFQFASGQVNIL